MRPETEARLAALCLLLGYVLLILAGVFLILNPTLDPEVYCVRN